MSTISKIKVNGVDYDIQDKNAQEKLVSGENIKTINSQSLLGDGNIDIQGGTNDYSQAINKPQINNNELDGNKTGDELNLQNKMYAITPQEIDNMIYGN